MATTGPTELVMLSQLDDGPPGTRHSYVKAASRPETLSCEERVRRTKRWAVLVKARLRCRKVRDARGPAECVATVRARDLAAAVGRYEELAGAGR
jgi:hypothetical protein